MMILDQIAIDHPNGAAPILAETSLAFGPEEKIGIFAGPGSGKSSIARVLCGIEPPSRGRVHLSDVSWPLGFAGFFHPHLTVQDNLTFLAQLTGQDGPYFVSLVAHLTEQPDILSMITRDLTPTQRAVLAYMASMAMATPAGILIADGVLTVGGERMRQKCDVLLDRRLAKSGLIFLSRNLRQVQRYCDRYFALRNGQLEPFEDAVSAHAAITMEPDHA